MAALLDRELCPSCARLRADRPKGDGSSTQRMPKRHVNQSPTRLRLPDRRNAEARRRELQRLRRQGRRRRAAPVRRRRRPAAGAGVPARSGAAPHLPLLACVRPRRAGRPDLRLPRPSAPTRREQGLRYDADKVLLDPYGRCVAMPTAYSREAASRPGDNAATAMKSVVVDNASYDWEGDQPLRRPIPQTVIYEMHVAGFTRHPSSGVAPEKRGTYAGLIEKIPYLQDLGITAVELLPVYQFDPTTAPAGLVNYWGYQPIAFFAPHTAYSSRPGPAGRARRVPRHGQGAAPGRHRGHPRRGVQPHRRGLRRRRHPELPRAGQRRLLHPGPRRQVALRRLHRLRQHAQRQPCGGAPADRRQPALLGAGDARRRLSLRPGVGADAR